MKEELTFEFNGKTLLEMNCKMKSRPEIPSPVHRFSEITIPGRDGTLLKDEKADDPIEITVPINFIADDYMRTIRQLRTWLFGSGKLIFSYDKDYFYKVTKIELQNATIERKKLVNLEAIFTCKPSMYAVEGQFAITNPTKIYNPDYSSKPIYRIEGEGTCTLTVNGNSITANVGQNVTIDTERQVAYRDNDRYVNSTISGSYEDIELNEGINTISITSGFDLYVTPNWRCR